MGAVEVAGLHEKADAARAVADDLDQAAGAALADVALARAASHRPVRSRVVGRPLVTLGRAIVAYAGVTTPGGFARAVTDDVGPVVIHALDDELEAIIERHDL